MKILWKISKYFPWLLRFKFVLFRIKAIKIQWSQLDGASMHFNKFLRSSNIINWLFDFIISEIWWVWCVRIWLSLDSEEIELINSVDRNTDESHRFWAFFSNMLLSHIEFRRNVDKYLYYNDKPVTIFRNDNWFYA